MTSEKDKHNYWKYTKMAWNDTLKVKYNEITAENGEVKKIVKV